MALSSEARRSGDRPFASAALTLTLLDSEGRERATRAVELPAHGALLTSVRDVWPNLDELLAPAAIGTVRIRSTEARLYGYSWIEEQRSLTFPICHLIGG